MLSFRRPASFPFSITLLFVLCVALTGVGAVAVVLAAESLTASNRAVERNVSVQRALEGLLLALVNAEAGQRGFLLTGQASFLEPYVDAVAKQAYTFGILDELTAGDAQLGQAIRDLKPLVDARLRQLAADIAEPRDEARDPTESVHRGKELMARVRASVDAVRRDQERDLARQRGDLDRHTRDVVLMLLGANGAGLLGLAVLYGAMRSDHRRRMAALDEIARREESYRALFEASPIGEGACDPQSTRILLANRQLEEITGHEADALRRTTVVDLLPRPSRLDNARAIRELVAGTRDALRLEQPLHRADGSTAWVELHLGVVRGADGSVERLKVLARDVTRRRRSEEVRASVETVLRAVCEHTSNLVFAKDVKGRYVYANPALQAALGRDGDAILGLQDEDLFPAPDAAALRAADGDALRDRVARWTEQTLAVGQETRVYSCNVAPYFDATGELAGTVTIGTDITGHAAEAARIRAAIGAFAEKAANATAATQAALEEERVRLAMELHDDLGASISAVWVEIVAVLTQLKKHAPQLVIRQERALNALTGLSQNVQRITAGLHPLLLEHTGLEGALDNYLTGWSTANAVRIDLQIDRTLPPLTREAELALFRIVQEAMTNVAKYAEATQVVVALHATDDDVFLSILDNGCGISDDALANPATRGIAGMRTRVGALGGTFWIGRRGSGRGTEVNVRLKRAEATR